MRPHSLSSRAADFLKLSTRQELAGWLGLSDRELRYILYVLRTDQKYTTFSIKKRNGSERMIDAPHKALKKLQKRLLSVISEIAPATGLAKAYVPDRSIIDHAWLHRRQRFVILADLKDFFPTITFRRVRGALLARPFELSPAVATCVAQLCCKDDALPQGAPTSPALSNLICRSLDHMLLGLAKKNRCRVSRYADDICISTSQPHIPQGIAFNRDDEWVAGSDLDEVVRKCGFALNHTKFKVRGREVTQLVTGLVVNNGVSLPRSWRRQLRVLLHLSKKFGEKRAGEVAATWTKPAASRKGFVSLDQVIRGKSHFSQFIDIRCDRNYSASLFRSYPSQRRLLPRPIEGTQLRLLTEGKTDLLHMEAAHRVFGLASDFTHLRPRFVNFPSDAGDVELLKTLRRIASSSIPELTIGLFDCDNPKFLKDAGLAPGQHLQIGSHVFAACLAPPDRLIGQPFCIELLFDRSELCATTSDHRRVFLADEFDSATGFSHDGIYRREHPKKNALVVSDQVIRVADGYSSLLSKAELATLVSQRVSPFEEMNFEGFRPTFQLIESIVDLSHGR